MEVPGQWAGRGGGEGVAISRFFSLDVKLFG